MSAVFGALGARWLVALSLAALLAVAGVSYAAAQNAGYPAVPGLSAVAGADDVTVSWNAFDGASFYYVTRSPGFSGAPHPWVSAPTTSYVDDTALPGVSYSYQVVARGASGAPLASSEVGPVSMAGSSDVSGSPEVSGPAEVSFPENSTDAVATYRAVGPDGNVASGVSLRLGYCYVSAYHQEDGGHHFLFSLEDGVLSFLSPPDYESHRDGQGRTHAYRVCVEAVDEDDNELSEMLVRVSVTDIDEDTSGNPESTTLTLTIINGTGVTGMPATDRPVNFTVSNAVWPPTISWTPAVGNYQYQQVWRRVIGGRGGWIKVNVPANVSSWQDTNPMGAGVEYRYRVRAITDNGRRTPLSPKLDVLVSRGP